MRKFLVAVFALVLLLGSSASIVTAQTSSDDDEATPGVTIPDQDRNNPPSTDDEDEDDQDIDDEDVDSDAEDSGVNPVDPQFDDVVTLYATSGAPIATFTVTDAERGWDDYEEYSEPERGSTYLAVSLEVENVSDEAWNLNPYDFILQDGQGFAYGNSYVSVVEDADPEVLEEEITIDGGDSWEGVVIFEIFKDQELAHLYWSDSGVLLTLADLSETA